MAAGAVGAQVMLVAEKMVAERQVRLDRAQAILATLIEDISH
jgi:hypothetical protein